MPRPPRLASVLGADLPCPERRAGGLVQTGPRRSSWTKLDNAATAYKICRRALGVSRVLSP